MGIRRERLETQIGIFIRQYGRKKRPGLGEPNDRKYDRALEERIRHVDPTELDELLRGEGDRLSDDDAEARET